MLFNPVSLKKQLTSFGRTFPPRLIISRISFFLSHSLHRLIFPVPADLARKSLNSHSISNIHPRRFTHAIELIHSPHFALPKSIYRVLFLLSFFFLFANKMQRSVHTPRKIMSGFLARLAVGKMRRFVVRSSSFICSFAKIVLAAWRRLAPGSSFTGVLCCKIEYHYDYMEICQDRDITYSNDWMILIIIIQL